MAVAGMILLGLLALVLLLLCIPVSVVLRYRTGEPPLAYLCWLFLKFDLQIPELPEKAEPEPAPVKKKKSKQAPAKKKPMEFATLAGAAIDLLSAAKGAAGLLIRRFRLYRVRVHLVVAEDDAAETALAYGGVNAAVYTAYALAAGFLNMKHPDIQIRPDFLAAEGSVDFELRGRLLPIIALAAGLRMGGSFLIKTLKRREAAKAESSQA